MLLPDEQSQQAAGQQSDEWSELAPDDTHNAGRPEREASPRARRSPLATRPHARRRRTLAGLSIGAMVAIAVGLILVISLPTPQTIGVLLHLPTPTTTPVVLPGDTQLYVIRGVYWGDLTIDGKTITTKELTVGPVSLGIGRHQIVYHARFFPTLHCMLSVPPSKADTCPLVPQAQVDTPNPDFGRARILDLGATFNRLPAAESQALLGALNQALGKLTQTRTLAPGEHYTTANGQIASADTPLTATLTPSVPASQHLYQPGRPDAARNEDACDPICDFQGSYGVLLHSWQLATYLYTSWRFTTPAGQSIVPPTRNIPQGQRILPFFAWWDASNGVVRWHVSVSPVIIADVECAQGQQQLFDLANRTNISGAALEPIVQQDATQGCLLLYQPPSQTQPLSAAAQVFYHFGVLLAVNDVARQLFPSLPLVTPSELTTAAQLFAQEQP